MLAVTRVPRASFSSGPRGTSNEVVDRILSRTEHLNPGWRGGLGYRIWNTRLLWLVLGFLLHRSLFLGLLIAFPGLERSQAVCTSFGLSSIWTFMVIECAWVPAVRRAEEASL
ncbi:MAG: hypothetical protein AAFU79_16200 [Myxococcota bacterium]